MDIDQIPAVTVSIIVGVCLGRSWIASEAMKLTLGEQENTQYPIHLTDDLLLIDILRLFIRGENTQITCM